MSNVFRYIIAWLGLVIIAILNGTLRVKVFLTYMSELSAHQLSTLVGIILFSIYIWFLSIVWPIKSSKQALTIGFIWLLITVLFEFIFGHYVIGNSWSKLFADYNIIHGRVWVIVLIWTTFAPYIIYTFQRKK
jgi:hypothetical protein